MGGARNRPDIYAYPGEIVSVIVPVFTMFKIRQCLGKYRIEKRLAEGAHAVVYQAFDTIEGIRIALKAPLRELVGPSYLEEFRR